MAFAFMSLQTAVYQRLSSDIKLNELITGVYDHVPEDTPFPYVVIGEPIGNPFEVKILNVEEISLVIHVWSKYEGKKEAYDILNACHNAMKYKLDVQGYKVERTQWENAKVFDDIDGVKKHGVVTLRFILTKE
ncbi:DUF3168 domain-containing protein [Bacillus sp. JJ722]|uniref:DUF3168 domain-containing protein n=1 Tax=Bacillus sp. JJ722 TaxID=3122973 RepID=UPI002FFFB9A2